MARRKSTAQRRQSTAAKKAAPRRPTSPRARDQPKRVVNNPPEFPRATAVRVAVIEALERQGGSLRDEHGIVKRLARLCGNAGAGHNIHGALLGLEEAGLVVLDTIPATRAPVEGARTIVEAVLVSIPPNFQEKIKELRDARGIRWYYQPERDSMPEDAVVSRTQQAREQRRVTVSEEMDPDEVSRIVSDLLGDEPEIEEPTHDGPDLGELLERIAVLEKENEQLKIQNMAMLEWIRQNRTEIEL